MNKLASFISAAGLAAALSGCVGSGPSTEQGAVTGGVLGAIAGGVIGHNSPHGDGATGALIGGVAGAVAGGAIGNSVDHENGTIYGSETQQRAVYNPDDRHYRVARTRVVEPAPVPSGPPPTPVETQPPAPASNAVWAPGYWLYDGRTYTWMAGHWETPPPMAHNYVPAHWENQNGHQVYVPGYWQ